MSAEKRKYDFIVEDGDENESDCMKKSAKLDDICAETLHKLASEKYNNKEYDEMVKLCEKAIAQGHTKSMCVLAKYYEEIGDIENAKKYYKMGADHDHIESICKLAEIMEKTNITEAMILYGRGIALKSSYCANKIGEFHDKTKNYVLAGEYFLKSCEMLETTNLLQHKGSKWYYYANYATCCHFRLKKYDDARKYYELALQHVDECNRNEPYIYVIMNFARFCKFVDKNKPKCIELYANCYAKMEPSEFENRIKQNHANELLPIYHELTKSYPTCKIIAEFRKLPEISKFINKMAYITKTNYVDACLICHETKLQICYDCFHTTCVDCYVEHGKCPLNLCNKVVETETQEP
jgi:tetratricopeptide (TPR) repeat protein